MFFLISSCLPGKNHRSPTYISTTVTSGQIKSMFSIDRDKTLINNEFRAPPYKPYNSVLLLINRIIPFIQGVARTFTQQFTPLPSHLAVGRLVAFIANALSLILINPEA